MPANETHAGLRTVTECTRKGWAGSLCSDDSWHRTSLVMRLSNLERQHHICHHKSGIEAQAFHRGARSIQSYGTFARRWVRYQRTSAACRAPESHSSCAGWLPSGADKLACTPAGQQLHACCIHRRHSSPRSISTAAYRVYAPGGSHKHQPGWDMAFTLVNCKDDCLPY